MFYRRLTNFNMDLILIFKIYNNQLLRKLEMLYKQEKQSE